MTDAAIDSLERIEATEDQPGVQNSGMLVEWRPNDPCEDEYDLDYVYTADTDENEDDLLSGDELYSDEDKIATDNLSNNHQPEAPVAPIMDVVLEDYFDVPKPDLDLSSIE
jgi:hypothetical protein